MLKKLNSNIFKELKYNIEMCLFYNKTNLKNQKVDNITMRFFKERLSIERLHNPLLYYLKLEWYKLDWHLKASLFTNINKEVKINNLKQCYIFDNHRLNSLHNRIPTYTYTELLSRIFISWNLHEIIKERSRSDFKISCLVEEWSEGELMGI